MGARTACTRFMAAESTAPSRGKAVAAAPSAASTGWASGDWAVGEAIGDGTAGIDRTPGAVGGVVIDHAAEGTPGMANRAAADQAAGTGVDKFTGGAGAGVWAGTS
ncbi:unnamed protein product [Coccothraustes coccothraustes]